MARRPLIVKIAGDPAWDLGAAWLLLPEGGASRFFDSYAQADEATVRRARGVAVMTPGQVSMSGGGGSLRMTGLGYLKLGLSDGHATVIKVFMPAA